MTFGSWAYSSQFLNLILIQIEAQQIDVLDSFSHTEWEISELQLLNYMSKNGVDMLMKNLMN